MPALSFGPLVRPLDPPILDPWKGWTASGGMLDTQPYFGPGCHAQIRLELFTRYAPYTDAERNSLPVLVSYWAQGRQFLASSCFQWTGGHFGAAPPETTRWWRRLKTWIRKAAVPLPTHDPQVIFWSFPFALEVLKRGVAYSANNWPLDQAIANATPSTRRR